MQIKLVIFVLLTFLVLQVQPQNLKGQTKVVKPDFVSEEGGFKIAFPGKPTKKVSNVEAAFGKTTMTIFSFQSTLTFYAVTLLDFPTVVEDEIEQDMRFDMVRDGVTNQFSGNLESEKNIAFGDYRGREFVVEAEGNTITVRLLLIEQRFFQLTIINRGRMSKSSERVKTASQKKVDDFFNSFAITKLPAPKTTAVELPTDFGLKIENRNLRIDFFGLTANLPETWTILNKEDVELLKDLGVQRDENKSEKAAKLLEYSLKNTEILLMMTEKELESGVNEAVFTISAEKVSFPNFLPEAAVKEYVKNSLEPTEKVTKQATPIEIGGAKFYWIETFDSADNSKMRFYVANRKGIAFQVFIFYKEDADLQTMLKSLQSMKFDAETAK